MEDGDAIGINCIDLEESGESIRMNLQTINYRKSNVEVNSKAFILGRDKEINNIVKHFDEVLNGAFAVCLLTGEAGVGKTYLVSHVARKLLNVNAIYLYGKYKHYNSGLFSAFGEVIKGIIEQTMTLSDKEMKVLKKLLIKKLGAESNLITEICPDAEMLLGFHRKTKEVDYHKLEYKFHNAVATFLDVLSQTLFPLIIHIDDLQWVDDGSKRMIKFLYSKRNSLNFYFILSSRNDIDFMEMELSSNTDLELSFNLGRLDYSDTKEYLNSYLCNQVKDIDKVANHFFKVTLGTPFYIAQLIESTFEKNKISYNKEMNKWVFESLYLESFQLPEDIEQILLNQLETLSDLDKEVLQLLACLGGQADKKLLNKVDAFACSMVQRLETLCETGLVLNIKNDNDALTMFHFSHDIIFGIVHKSMQIETKEKNHFRIANRLMEDLDKVFIDEHRIFIASQLKNSMSYVQREVDSTKYILEMYYAGVKAKHTTSVELATQFFKLCILLIPSADQSILKNLIISIKLELAEGLHIIGEINEAETEFNQLIMDYTDNEDLVQIKSRLVLLNTYAGRYEKVIELSLEILGHLDYKLNTKYTKLNLGKELLDCKMLFTDKKIEQMKYVPMVNDKRIVDIETTLIRMAAVANLTDEDLFALTILKLSNLLAKHGNSDFSPPAYAVCSFIFYHILGDEKKAFQFAETAEYFLDYVENTKCMTYFLIGNFIEHWKSSGVNSIALLRKSIESGDKEGEFQYAGYAFTTLIELKYIMGVKIPELEKNFKLLDQYDNRLNHDITKSTLVILQNHLDQMKSEYAGDLEGHFISGIDMSQQLTYYAFKLQRNYIMSTVIDEYQFEDGDSCKELIVKMEPMVGILKGYMTQVHLLFYMTLVKIDCHAYLNGLSKIKNKRSIESAIKQFEKWLSLCKDNHYARYVFIKARYAEVIGSSINIGALYEEGVSFANEHNQHQLVALGNLLASKYYDHNKKIALIYRKEAIEAFAYWGANRFSKMLIDKYQMDSQNEKDSMAIDILAPDRNKNIAEVRLNPILNIARHMKHVESMDIYSTYQYALDNIILESTANYGVVFLEDNDQIHMVYEQKDGKSIRHLRPIPMEKAISMPHKVMRYVIRTGSEVCLNNLPESGPFANDTFFNRSEEISLLCIPLKYLNVSVGILYVQWSEANKCTDIIIDIIKNYMPLLITKTIAEEKLNNEKNKNANQQDIPLTKRELEVFKLIIKGLTNKQVGEELSISLSTVKTHIINIYSKLDIKNRVSAVEKAKELGFIE